MAKEQVTVPDIGGAEGAEVIEVLVAVGDAVEVDQGLIVLESDKASMEIPSTAAGTVAELLVEVGQELSEGAPVAVIEAAGESTADTGGGESVESEPPETSASPPSPAVAADPAPVPTGTSAGQELTVTVPDIGTDEEVDLIEVCVKVGDTVAEGDSLVVLESDKASMEVPAPCAGEVIKVLVAEGGTVRQGDELLICKTDEAGAAVPASAAEPEKARQSAEVAEAATGGPSPQAVEPPAADVTSPPVSAGGGIYAGPAVRKLAREFGIDLKLITGTGPRGRIVKEDLHQFVQKSLSGKKSAAPVSGTGIPPIPEVDFSAFGPVEVTDRSKLDKLTAANMQRSWLNLPHVTQFDEADITGLEEFRASLKTEAERRGSKITPMPFLLKACAVALRDNPKFCSSLTAEGEKLASKHYTHIGMAVDTPAGLVVPVIRDVDRKSIWELAEEVLVLAGKARDRKLSPAEMQGGCFTISSLGNIGGNGFTPIVNAPEVGILGVSRADIKPVWDGQTFVPRKMLPLSLSYDHRVINGADAGKFLTGLVALLSDIRKLIM